MAGFIDIKEKEWRPTTAILRKMRSEGSDTSGLKNLIKMLTCIAKHEQKVADQAADCKKSLVKIWNKSKDEPFMDDFGTNLIKGVQSYARLCSANSKTAFDQGPINLIQELIDEAENNFKDLLQTKFDLDLIFLIKQRSELLTEIDLCKQEYHNSCRDELNQTIHSGVSNHHVSERQRRTCEAYRNVLQVEEEDRAEFINLCREARANIMRHQVCLSLNKKDAYSMAADWLEKTSLVKAQGGSADAMVEFLRKEAEVVNSKEYIEGWKKLHCQEIVVPQFVQHDINKDSRKPVPKHRETTFPGDYRNKPLPKHRETTLPEDDRHNSDGRRADGQYIVCNNLSLKQSGDMASHKDQGNAQAVTGKVADKEVRRTIEMGAGGQKKGAKAKKKLKMMLT